MENWLKISLLLCVFGFLKEIRPSEPFVTDFLIKPWRNITLDEVNHNVYPMGTYSTMILSIVVLLITDFLRYKPVIIILGISGIITWILLLETTTLFWLLVIQVTYAMYIASEVAYFTYIYAKVPKEHYLQVTSHSRAALLIGKCMSGSIGQILVHTKLMDIRQLNYISLGAQVAATIVAMILPRADKSIYFNRIESIEAGNQQKIQNAFELIGSQLRNAYSNHHVVLWSIWYAFAVCGYFQVWIYSQTLWSAIDDDPTRIWNGAVDAAITLCCAGVALLASRLHENFFKTKLKLLSLLSVQSAFMSLAIFLMTNTIDRYVSYAGYTIFYILYTFTVTIASAEIAKYLPDDSFGLVFGINTFIALVLQSALTAAVVSDMFLSFTIFQQFNVYASYFACLGCIYLLMIIIRLIRRPVKHLKAADGEDAYSLDKN